MWQGTACFAGYEFHDEVSDGSGRSDGFGKPTSCIPFDTAESRGLRCVPRQATSSTRGSGLLLVRAARCRPRSVEVDLRSLTFSSWNVPELRILAASCFETSSTAPDSDREVEWVPRGLPVAKPSGFTKDLADPIGLGVVEGGRLLKEVDGG